jgi:aspartyl-tRNA(Asn)/glutamyl-tRNA(Gln) amidotransferase subunit A
MDAAEIADAVRAGELTAKETVEAALERIEIHDQTLNSFVHLDAERAREAAASIDERVARGEDPGPLAGVPFGVKDLEDAEGMPTTHGSLLFEDEIAKTDSVLVARMKAAGAIALGKTAAPEFGASYHTATKLHGVTRNPWNPERTPGGSSGGSAAATAAGLVPLATASDGGGSIRIPASYSGLPGFKGTYGRVPKGHGPESSHTSVHGPLARTVRDTARALDAVVGKHELDSFSLPAPGFLYEEFIERDLGQLRATWSDGLGFGMSSKEVSNIAREAAEKLSEAGAFEWNQTDVKLRDPALGWSVLAAAGTFLRVSPFWPEKQDDLMPATQMGISLSQERLDVSQLAKAIERRFINDKLLAEVFEEVDIIVTPTTATTAIPAEGPPPREIDGKEVHAMMAICCCYPFNVSGHPAMTVPCGLDSEGMPVGLQFVARRHEDHLVLALARQFEQLKPWVKIAPGY